MNEMSRREVLQVATASGAILALPALDSAVAAGQAVPDKTSNPDRGFVLGAGMTEAEADCWELAAKTAAAFFALPELHPMDAQEVATAIHVIQNKLLSRPTYRTYRELAKAHHG